MEIIDKFIKQRKEKNLLRTLTPSDLRKNGKIYFNGRKYIDLSSNDYLNLSSHPFLKEKSKTCLKKLGTSSSASRLLSGDLNLFHKLEDRVAKFKNKESALIFNSGYQANIGIINSLGGKDTVIFCDRLSHASIIDGILISHSKFYRFRHNDMEHLETLLEKKRNKFKYALIITESIFSMDGDTAPLDSIVELKKKYNSMLMIDEAHATGIYGENGSGLAEEYKLSNDIDLIMGTFSKALGSFGAYLACSEKIKEYLVNICRSFIYSTALPPVILASNLASIKIIKEEPWRRKKLKNISNFFRNGISKLGFETKSKSQIVPFIVGKTENSIKAAETLRKEGFWVFPIREPTVPAGEARLRFSLTSLHEKETIKRLLDSLSHLTR